MNGSSLFSIIGSVIGGVGLFLLGMRLMTDGLKYAAGTSLRDILENSTSTPLRGILSGALITSLVQSSSAVTVAAIGFVNAGLLDLSHSISIIYGSNIGTTMTGWLVSMVGFKFNINTFAIPLVGIGMLFRLSPHEGRRSAMGDVLAGFGVFFIGVEVLKTTFAGAGENINLLSFAGDGFASLSIFVAIGFLLTLLMQSSSASMAVILTAMAGDIITLNNAAATVIGANVGTTSTAALSVIGATSNAKRLATGHVIFNIVTGIVALALLPFLLTFLGKIQNFLGLGDSPAILLALFHTIFNVLGVLLLYPFTKSLVKTLNSFFHTREEDEAQTRHLDRNVMATPVMAMQAIFMELKRIGDIAFRMAKGAISSEAGPSSRMLSDKHVLDQLINSVGDFINLLMRKNMPPDLDDLLANALRISGYYVDLSELAIDLAKIQNNKVHTGGHEKLAEDLHAMRRDVVNLLKRFDVDLPGYSHKERKKELEELKEEYRALKARMLREASKGNLTVSQMVADLEAIARIRRIAEQAEKAARYLLTLRIEKEKEENGETTTLSKTLSR